MQVKLGKVHKYLGMMLDCSAVVQVKITMLNYNDEIIYAFDKTDKTCGSNNSSASPAIIFKVNKDCKKCNTKQALEFHHLVAKILFDTKRAIPDTCTAILFLTTIVREHSNENWAKFFHIMKYIRGTRNLPHYPE